MKNNKSKRVFIIHGWEADPNCNWFPWLKNELTKNGIEAEVPGMPNSVNPKESEWVSYLQKVVGTPDNNTFLIGHSLGVITILRYLNSLKEGEKIGGAILVAGSAENPGFPELASFFETPLDFEKIKKASHNFIVIHSDDDPVVPLVFGKKVSEKLETEFLIVPNCGHLDSYNGLLEMPMVLEKILAISK